MNEQFQIKIEDRTSLIIGSKTYNYLGPWEKGGVGEISLVESTEDGRIHVIKQFTDPDNFQDAYAVLMAEIADKKSIDERVNPETLQILYDFEEGLDLGQTFQMLNDKDNLQWITDVIYLARKMAIEIGKYHNTGRIHADIKPNNFIYNFITDEVVLIDKDLSMTPDEAKKLKEELTLVGTCFYGAPEMFTYAEMSYQSDIYAFGMNLFSQVPALLTMVERVSTPSQLAFMHTQNEMYKHTQKILERLEFFSGLEDLIPEVQAELSAKIGLLRVIEKCLAPKRLRYQTMDEVVQDLSKLQSQE